MEAFGNQAETNHQQEAQTQHHYGGVFIDKLGERLARHNHHRHRHHHRGHRHHNMIHHRHRGNHRIDGKHGIQHQNLRHHRPKRHMGFLGIGHRKVVVPFQALVQFGGRFIKQEQAAGKHDDVFTRHLQTGHAKQRLGKRNNLRHKAQHNHPNQHRQSQTGNPRFVAQRRFDFIGQNRHKNQIVDTEYDFEYQKRCKAYPCMRFG